MKGRILSITVSIALLAALIYISGPLEIVDTLSHTNIFIIPMGLFVWFIGAIIRTERWRFLLRKANVDIPFIDALKVYIAGLFLSNVTPGKSGDPIRSVLLKKVSGASVSVSLPSIIVERALDIGTMVLIGSIGLILLAGSAASDLITWFIVAIVVYAVTFIFVIFVLSSEHRAKWMARKLNLALSKIPKIKNYVERAEGFVINMRKSLYSYRRKNTIMTGMLFSLLVWLIEGVIIYISFLALGFHISYIVSVTALCVATLIAVLTFLPGGVGSGEVVIVVFITSVTTLTLADITAAAIIARILSYWVYVSLGAVLLVTMKYKYSV